jgi:ribosomal protein L24E
MKRRPASKQHENVRKKSMLAKLLTRKCRSLIKQHEQPRKKCGSWVNKPPWTGPKRETKKQ